MRRLYPWERWARGRTTGTHCTASLAETCPLPGVRALAGPGLCPGDARPCPPGQQVGSAGRHPLRHRAGRLRRPRGSALEELAEDLATASPALRCGCDTSRKRKRGHGWQRSSRRCRGASVDAQGRLLALNAAGRELGLGPGEAITGWRWPSPSGCGRKSRRGVTTALEGPEHQRCSESHWRGGHVLQVMLAHERGWLLEFLSVIAQDISLEAAERELRQHAADGSDWASGQRRRHDINNLLTPIMTYSELLNSV